MDTRNRKRRRPSVKLHQHPSQNLPGTSQQPRQLPSTQMPDQLPPNQQPVQLPPNQQPVQLPLTPSHRLGQWSSNQQSGHQPDQLPLSQQLGDQMQPAASQPDPAVQSGGMSVGTLSDRFQIKCLEFTCMSRMNADDEKDVQEVLKETNKKAVDAFKLLMAGGRRLFTKRKTSSSGVNDGLSRKDELFNDLVGDFEKQGLDWPSSQVSMEGAYFIQCHDFNLSYAMLCGTLQVIMK
ncbi:uncharacterized protein LOC127840883 isoform X3 [Dreissena polymorpha]|uniref:Uncharacterized protein n=1 Tax=Dreissena polymorpha TaxID=45954 RepID=A0A9D4ETL7_DREPO|nr:uncharacterized protein LOC127840883 isoform X3 [Dreissena polymorpha]KAH3786699.1 hypothetical protein DPMN_164808 [Dreissena polymorpha]